jgi:hypothetical protein
MSFTPSVVDELIATGAHRPIAERIADAAKVYAAKRDADRTAIARAVGRHIQHRSAIDRAIDAFHRPTLEAGRPFAEIIGEISHGR